MRSSTIPRRVPTTKNGAEPGWSSKADLAKSKLLAKDALVVSSKSPAAPRQRSFPKLLRFVGHRFECDARSLVQLSRL